MRADLLVAAMLAAGGATVDEIERAPSEPWWPRPEPHPEPRREAEPTERQRAAAWLAQEAAAVTGVAVSVRVDISGDP